MKLSIDPVLFHRINLKAEPENLYTLGVSDYGICYRVTGKNTINKYIFLQNQLHKFPQLIKTYFYLLQMLRSFKNLGKCIISTYDMLTLHWSYQFMRKLKRIFTRLSPMLSLFSSRLHAGIYRVLYKYQVILGESYLNIYSL